MVNCINFLQSKSIYFNERLLSLSSQQKKILIVATLAFGCLAAIYALSLSILKAKEKNIEAADKLAPKIPSSDDFGNLQEGSPLLTAMSSHPQIDIDSISTIIFNQNKGKYIYISPALPIKNLVISGGGAKGVILPGVIKAFEEHRVGDISFRDQLDHVAGSSIGAITAAFIAIGTAAEDLIAAAAKEDFKALLGKGYGPLFKDGNPLLNFMRTQIQTTLSKHLMDMCGVANLEDITDIKGMVANQLKKQNKVHTQQEVDELANHIQEIVEILKHHDASQVHITFSMLHALRELDPHTFKDLTVTATCRENGQTYYFDAINTPHLEIAVACRASASLPLILNPVKIAPKFLLPGYVHDKIMSFADGGYLDNIPVGAVEKKQGEANLKNKGEHGQNLQTLVLIFDGTKRHEKEQSPFHEHIPKHVIYNSSNPVARVVRDVIPKWVGGINTKERNTITKKKRMHEIRKKYMQRNIPLLIDVEANDFVKAQKEQSKYIDLGYQQAKEYLVNHDGESIYRSFDSLDDLLDYLPEEDRKKHGDRILAFAKDAEGIAED